MTNIFNHGTTTLEGDIIRPISSANITNVIGIVGTSGKGPINEPQLITSFGKAQEVFGTLAADNFTLVSDLRDIFNQGNFQVVAVNVASRDTLVSVTNEEVSIGSTGSGNTTKNFVSSVSTLTTVKADVQLDGNGETTLPAGITSIDAVKDSAGVTLTATTDYTIAGTTITAVGGGALSARDTITVEYTATLAEDTDYSVDGDTGTITVLPGNLLVNSTITVSYDHVDPTVTDTDIIGAAGASTEDNTGVHALIKAKDNLGVTPKIISAPSSNSNVTPASGQNLIVAELLTIAEKLGAVVITNTPKDQSEAVIFRNLHKNKRLFAVQSAQEVTINGTAVEKNLSALTAGLFAKSDAINLQGTAASPSNQVANGITKIVNPVAVNITSPGDEGDVLNLNGIAFYANISGFRLWGNRSTTDDTAFTFINTIRTCDFVKETIAESQLELIDKNITNDYINILVNRVNNKLGQLVTRGVLNYRRVYANEDLNTPSSLQSGRVYIDYEIGIPGVAENIIFTANVVNGYLANIEEAN